MPITSSWPFQALCFHRSVCRPIYGPAHTFHRISNGVHLANVEIPCRTLLLHAFSRCSKQLSHPTLQCPMCAGQDGSSLVRFVLRSSACPFCCPFCRGGGCSPINTRLVSTTDCTIDPRVQLLGAPVGHHHQLALSLMCLWIDEIPSTHDISLWLSFCLVCLPAAWIPLPCTHEYCIIRARGT